jgi:hypothetical protein
MVWNLNDPEAWTPHTIRSAMPTLVRDCEHGECAAGRVSDGCTPSECSEWNVDRTKKAPADLDPLFVPRGGSTHQELVYAENTMDKSNQPNSGQEITQEDRVQVSLRMD